MNGSQRREQIVRQIQESKDPVSGKKLAELYGVSRQVIVQDIALIAQQAMILSQRTEDIY